MFLTEARASRITAARLGVDEALHGFVEGDAGADEDREYDTEPPELFAAGGAKDEGDPERDRGERVAEVVDQVGEQRDRAGEREDRDLGAGGERKKQQAEQDRLDARA